ALRGFGANRGFTCIAVACLTLGIAANTAIFSIFESTLFSPLPFDQADQLVSVAQRNERTGRRSRLSYPQFHRLRARSSSFSDLEAYTGRTVAILDESDRAELVRAQLVSAGFLPMLGAQPAIGRGFTPDDDHPGAPLVALLSDDIWRRRYGADPHVLGRVVRLDATPHTVVGVMPPGFRYPGSSDVWTPLGSVFASDPLESRTVSVVGRVRPGLQVDGDRLADELAAAGRSAVLEGPSIQDDRIVEARPLASTFIGGEERLVTNAMMGAVTLLLLLACANVASLLLVRAASRERELALRTALGAGRWRLLRQMLVESVLLAIIAAVVAVPLAASGLRAFGRAIPPSDPLPFFVTFQLSRAALIYTSLVALITGVAFGLAPALLTSQTRPIDALRADGPGSGLAPRRVRLLSSLVVTEIALAVTLLVGSSHFVRTFYGLSHVELGYDPSRIMTMRFYLPGEAYDSRDARVRAVRDIQEALETVPGVAHAAISDLIPLEDDGGAMARVEVDGAPAGGRDQRLFYAGVLGDWLQTFAVDVSAGRDFEPAELRQGIPVAVINRTMATEFWPEGDAVGRRFRFQSDTTRTWYSVVGVVPDIRTVKLDEDQRTPPTAFVPIHTLDTRDFGVMLRTSGAPPSVTQAARDAVAAVDRDVPTYKVWPMDDVKWLSFWMYGLWSTTFASFALIALVLAAIGVYGVVSYGVRERRREMGVRIALGASRRGVVGLVVARGARVAALGLVIGLVAAAALTRVVGSLLIGVSASDPVTYLAVLGFLGGVACVASLLPALRAAGLDPLVAMRD
ncbi:MAG: ABC transporter permease, partial [Gemmatimonadota bacterium]